VLVPEPLRWTDAPPAGEVAIPGITKFA